MIDLSSIELTFYIVRSKDGKYFRAKGFSGYGDSWVDDVKKAKVYQKIGPARSQVTFWADKYPEHGIPDIVEITVSGNNAKILDESKRVKSVINKKKKKELQRKIYLTERTINDYKFRLKREKYLKHDIERLEIKLQNQQKELSTL